MTRDYKKLVDELLPPDWNPSDEEFEELEAEFLLVTTPEGWAETEKERERLYLEEVEIRKRRGSQE